MRNIAVLLVIFALVSLSCALDYSTPIQTPLFGATLTPVYWLSNKEIITSCDISGIVPQPTCSFSGHTVTIGSSPFQTALNDPPYLNVRGPGWSVPFKLWYTSTCSSVCVHGTCNGATCSCSAGWGAADCNTPVPVITSISPTLRATPNALTITITGTNGLFGDGTNLVVGTALRTCLYLIYVDAYNVACTLPALGYTPSPGGTESIQVTHNSVRGAISSAYASSNTAGFADNYLFTGVWGNGVYDCGTSQCSNSFSNWNVANYDYHGGWYGWKINFNSNRNGQSSVATNFKNHVECKSGAMYGLHTIVSSPSQLNFYFGVNLNHYSGGRAVVYFGQGHTASYNNWWICSNSLYSTGSGVTLQFFLAFDNGVTMPINNGNDINQFNFNTAGIR